MPDIHFIGGGPPSEKAKILPHGTGIVISVGLVALAVGVMLNLWLDGNFGKPKFWYAATMAIVVLTVCLAAIGFYRDREDDEYDKYIKNLRKIDKITYKAQRNGNSIKP